MTIRRRDFLATTAAAGFGMAAGAGGTAGDGTVAAAETAAAPITPPQPAVFKLSCQEGIMVGRTLKEKLDNMEEMGYVGFEASGDGLPRRVDEITKALQGRKVKPSAVCGGIQGWLIAEDPAIQQKAVASMKELLAAAGQLGSTGLIMVPAFNSQKSLPHKEARKVLIDHLKSLGEVAVQAKTRILLEPLNRRECHFLRQLADAAAICKDVDSPGVGMMGDFWHMTWEEPSDLGAFISAGDYLHHVHMASRKTRRIPGLDAGDNYVLGFKGLKWIGYRDYISLECGGPREQDQRKKALAACAKLLRDQWDQA